MDKHKIPNDEHGKRLVLKARKDALEEMLELFEEHDLNASRSVVGAMHSEIDSINLLLSGG